MNPTFGDRFSKKQRAKGRLSTVMRISGYSRAKDATTGTIIATSPIAEKRIMSKCSVFTGRSYFFPYRIGFVDGSLYIFIWR